MEKIRTFIKKYIPRWVIIAFILSLIALTCFIIAINSTAAADAINGTIGNALRIVMAKLTMYVPFSIFEILLMLILPALILFIVWQIKWAKTKERRLKSISCIVGIIMFFYTGYVFMLQIGYHQTYVDDRMGIDRVEITKENLLSTTELMVEKVNDLKKELDFHDGESHMNMDFKELSEKVFMGYEAMLRDYPILTNFKSRAKPILCSGIMSDTGTTGIYTYFTGESNINTAYPDYTIPYVVAHEFAHQRGIIRENEANFVAFIVCIKSGHPYLEYSGYLNMYEYLANALYKTDKDLYREVFKTLDEQVKDDIRAANAVSKEHRDSWLYKLSNRINDSYLKANGTPGAISYNYVVKSTIAYYEGKYK